MRPIILNNINTAQGLNRHILTLAVLLLLLTGVSCQKYVEIPSPVNQVVSSEVFSNDQTATAAVVGLYSQMMTPNLYLVNGALTVYCGLSADEIANTASSTTYDPFLNNALTNNNATVLTPIWRNAYNYIYQANACIEGLSATTGISSAVKNQLTGEMKFTRALCYFYLVNLFGDVPLETSTDYHVNESLGRASASLVYQQIVSDLSDAQNLLTAAYPTTGMVRPNKYAAMALLSRAYLYQQDWKDAVAAATGVISSGSYSLVTNLNNVFLSGSTEAIYSLLPVNTNNTAEGATFIPSSATVKPAFALTTFLLNSFETGDQRKTAWLKANTVSAVAYNYPYKYKVKSGTTKTEYEIVLRYAEQFLIRAEANAQQGNISAAIADINIIRNRAGLSSLPVTLNQQACLAAIAQENRIEFFTEWGHRWLDLKRTGQAGNILGAEKPGWSANAALYPIPNNDILLNPSLVQNPGY